MNVDIPSKSWDRKAVFNLWNRMDNDDARDLIAPWLKDRYFRKHNISDVKNMDKAVAALSNIELKALLSICKTADAKFLDTPVYEVQPTVHEDSKADRANMQNIAGNAPLLGSSSKAEANAISTKFAGINKTGMAQPRRNRG